MADIVVVTGAGGFIGHHLVSYLKSEGYFVRGADIKEPEYEMTKADEFFQTDLREKENCFIICKDAKWVFHLAADMGGIGFISQHHADVCINNSKMNINMLEAAKECGVKRFLFSSTACVYPMWMQKIPEIKPLKEADAHPAEPEEGYGWEKLYMEKLCEYFTKDYGFETRVARFHNVYGPMGSYQGGREKAPAAVCFKVSYAKANDEIEVWGDGKQTRSFMYVKDCVEGVLRLMKSDCREPLNLGTEEMITIDELYDLASDLARKPIRKNHNLSKPQGVRGRNSDNSKIRAILGWEPKISIQEGLKPTLTWIQSEVKRLANGNQSALVGESISNVKSTISVVEQLSKPVLPIRSAFALELSKARQVMTYPAADPKAILDHNRSIQSLAEEGGVNILPMPIPAPGGWWPFDKLDKAYRSGDRALMEAYEEIARTVTSNDILVVAGGSMMHPEFVKSLPSYNVLICCDDPDSSAVLSQPVAPSFDFSFTLNVACVDDYKRWGCKNADWLFVPPGKLFQDNAPTDEEMLNPKRNNKTVMFCERTSGISDRAQRIEKLLQSFPRTLVRGQGWPGGFITDKEMIAVYKNTKIGWNLHNSLGPTNLRTYSLPLMGLLQICDNKSHLSKIFKLDEEVIGFDSLEECIDKTKYYLAHEEERQEIAYRGWKRMKTEYTLENYYVRFFEKIAEDAFRKRRNIPSTVEKEFRPSV